jgi:hypothetical protein
VKEGVISARTLMVNLVSVVECEVFKIIYCIHEVAF